MGILSYITEWVNSNPGKAAGAVAGFILGILILTLGIAKTILILLFIIFGFIIGKMIDDRESVTYGFRNIFRKK